MTDLHNLRESVAGVLESECGLDRVQRSVEDRLDLDGELRQIVGRLGWLAMCVPESLGGFDMGDDVAQMIAEEAGRSLAPEFLSTLLVATKTLARFAPTELRDRYLPAAMAASLKVAIDADLVTRTVKGQRVAIGPSDADLLITTVETTDGNGIELGIVECTGDELRPADAWDVTRQLSLVGDVPRKSLCRLGVEAQNSIVGLWAILVASDSLGAWEHLARRTIDYLGLREQFGQKLGSFQALKHRLADLHADHHVRGALLGTALSDQSAAEPRRGNWAFLAKAEITDAAVRAAAECLQLHGGIGFTWEHECHMFLKRVRLNQSLIADNDALRFGFGRAFAGHVSAPAVCGDVHLAVR